MSTRSLNWLKLTAVVAPTFVLALFFAGLLNFPRQSLAQERNARTPIIKVDAPRIPAARPLVDLSDAYAAVAEAVRPSVVYIQSDRPVDPKEQSQIFGQLPPGFQIAPRGARRGQNDQPQLEHGSGSGFIVSSDGYILTNNHVIEGSSKVTVRLLNGREYNARIVGTDKDTDVGVLKIDATGLTPSALGSSDGTKVGEWVLAIGNPLGEDLTFTVTQGIVSAKGRAKLDLGDNDAGMVIRDYIQTDAVINRGNSGGPLVNARGEVIGINAAIASQTGYFTGYAFAVPIDLARKVMDQIVARGKVERAGMQIKVGDASREDADYLGLPSVSGVTIGDFTNGDNSAAKRAGMQIGDVIVAIDDQPIRYTSQLQQTVGFRRPGETVKVDVYRKDGKHTFNVRLVNIDATTQLADAATPTPATPKSDNAAGVSKTMLGIVTEPLTAATATEIGLPATTHGLLVRSVIDGTPAARAFCGADADCGPPDVIVSVEGKAVKNEEELKAALAGAVRGVVTMEIASGTRDHKGSTRIQRVRLR